MASTCAVLRGAARMKIKPFLESENACRPPANGAVRLRGVALHPIRPSAAAPGWAGLLSSGVIGPRGSKQQADGGAATVCSSFCGVRSAFRSDALASAREEKERSTINSDHVNDWGCLRRVFR